MKRCTVIGISDAREQWFEPRTLDIIKKGKVFSGGKRHHEIMHGFLPENAVWIDITVPLSDVFEQYKEHDDIVIFASGDPLFYGFASTIQREVPECDITVIPYFNSLQMLAHRMCLPYQDMHVVSLTGRPWDKFDEALINGENLIGCLTDKNKTPKAIWQRMMEYGYDNYDMTVGECLGNEEKERVTGPLTNSPLTPEGGSHPETEKWLKRECEDVPRTAAPFGGRGAFGRGAVGCVSFLSPNCIILRKTHDKPRHFGIPESEFELLDGRAKMITKAPIRLVTLSALNIMNARTFWDIGFCTGSVSIEAKLLCPSLHIESFEIRPECEEIINKNMRRFGAPGINIHIGDFLSTDISELPSPDAVFIGGHGGKLMEIVGKVLPHTNKNTRFVINSVSSNSRDLAYESVKKFNLRIISDNRVALDEHNPINIITFAR